MTTAEEVRAAANEAVAQMSWDRWVVIYTHIEIPGPGIQLMFGYAGRYVVGATSWALEDAIEIQNQQMPTRDDRMTRVVHGAPVEYLSYDTSEGPRSWGRVYIPEHAAKSVLRLDEMAKVSPDLVRQYGVARYEVSLMTESLRKAAANPEPMHAASTPSRLVMP